MNKTKTILSDFYDAWRDQDVDRMASYLPHDFAHVIHVPSELEPLGGERLGKAASLERLAQIFAQYDCLSLEASEMMIEGDRAAVEIEMHCRHRETRDVVKATKANFWTSGKWLAGEPHRILRRQTISGPDDHGGGTKRPRIQSHLISAPSESSCGVAAEKGARSRSGRPTDTMLVSIGLVAACHVGHGLVG